jgi:hypothetical protein
MLPDPAPPRAREYRDDKPNEHGRAHRHSHGRRESLAIVQLRDDRRVDVAAAPVDDIAGVTTHVQHRNHRSRGLILCQLSSTHAAWHHDIGKQQVDAVPARAPSSAAAPLDA